MLKLKNRGIILLLVVSILAVFAVGCGGSSDQPNDEGQASSTPKFLSIGTGGTAGTYYPLGGSIAGILNSELGMNATAETTGASKHNINLLKDGSIDFAFVQNDVSYYADQGVELFEEDGKVEGLQALATLYPETCQIITVKETGIKSVADFKGKKVAVGAIGSGVEANARQILKANGLTYEDINVKYQSFSEAANSLKDGNIDAAFLTAGFPTAAIQDISAQHDVVIIPIEDAVADQLIKDYPFYTKITIPAKTYPNQDVDVQSISVKAMLVATDRMDEQTAYDIVKAIYSNLDTLKAAHSVGKIITTETAQDGISIPMHPGAQKYFDEVK